MCDPTRCSECQKLREAMKMYQEEALNAHREAIANLKELIHLRALVYEQAKKNQAFYRCSQKSMSEIAIAVSRARSGGICPPVQIYVSGRNFSSFAWAEVDGYGRIILTQLRVD